LRSEKVAPKFSNKCSFSNGIRHINVGLNCILSGYLAFGRTKLRLVGLPDGLHKNCQHGPSAGIIYKSSRQGPQASYMFFVPCFLLANAICPTKCIFSPTFCILNPTFLVRQNENGKLKIIYWNAN
jgi:hypothetical protein